MNCMKSNKFVQKGLYFEVLSQKSTIFYSKYKKA